MRVAGQMAAVATIRQGFERFVIAGAQSDSNVRTAYIPNSTTTTGTVTTYGNTSYGTFNTTPAFTPILLGRNKADLGVVMFNQGDPGYENALDARQILGVDWAKIAKDGVSTCAE